MKQSLSIFAALCCILSLLTTQKALAQFADYTWYKGVFYANKWYEDQLAFVGVVTFTNTKGTEGGNYSSLSGDVYIASKVPGVKTIKRIASGAFYGKKNGGMINVTLPSTIEVIEASAFSYATKLYSIRLNEGLTSMQNDVFAECTALTEVYLPSTLNMIPNRTFIGCTSLPAIALSAGIEHIGLAAFRGCTALQSVKSQSGANNVKTIGESAFYNCTSLYDVRFSNGMTSIGKYAFYGCTKLENLTLPAKLATIGDFAFAYSGLKTLTVNMTTPIDINANVFYNVNLSQCTLYVPKGCKDAYKNANVWKKFGTILEIGEVPVEPITTGTKKIGDLWYDLHEDLTAKLLKHNDNKALTGAIKVPATVTFGKYTYTVNEMAVNVFENCLSITSVTVPNAISAIPYQAFKNCTGLTNVTLPSALTSIGSYAFNDCSALTFVSLPASLTEIGASAFWGCKALTSVYIPAGIKTIKNYCFKSCDKLATISLPEGLTEIEQQAFIGCTSLKTITLPASLAQMGDDVFSGNDGMVSIRSLRETPPTATANTFRNMNNTSCILYVPQGTKDAYAAATGWSKFAHIQEKGVNEKIKYGSLYYQLEEDGTAYVTFETEDENNYKSLTGEITVEDKVIYHGFEYRVNEVGIDAFNSCTGITKVNLPLIMDEISYRAFKGCTNLAEVNIPSTLSFLINTAFEDTKLFNDNKDADGAVYYDGCLLYYPLNAITGTYSVKEGTRLIATDVFEFDEKITELILPEGLQCLCNGSVTTMYALKTLHLPSSLYYIGGDFCNDCFYLTTIYNYSDSPVDLSDNYCFDNVNQSKCTLYVPKGSRTAYESASVWQDFPLFEMKGVYTVTFEDYDGFELKSEKVTEGGDATAPADPEREGYHFTGWDKEFDNVQSDLTVTATYAINTYNVTFYDKDGTTDLKTESVNYGYGATAPEYKEYEGLHFTGWDKDFDVITADLDVYAQYAVNTYTVTFLDWDDTVLKTEQVEHGNDATAPVDPIRENYTFNGWDADFHEVKSDMTINATYAINTYTVTFVDWDEKVLKSEKVEHGSAATAPDEPTREGYTFTGWDQPLENITSDLYIYAQYEENKVYFTVTYFDWNMTILGSEQVEEGQDAKGLETDPEREGYTFTGWSSSLENVTSDLNVQAQYEENKVYFTVTYYDWNMTVLGTEKVEEGKDAKGLDPSPEREGYTFTGWSSPLTNVTSDLNVQAQYEKQDPTALDEAGTQTSPRKFIENGVLYIYRNGILYTPHGTTYTPRLD